MVGNLPGRVTGVGSGAGCSQQHREQSSAVPVAWCDYTAYILGTAGCAQGRCSHSCGAEPKEEEAGQAGCSRLHTSSCDRLRQQTHHWQAQHISSAGMQCACCLLVTLVCNMTWQDNVYQQHLHVWSLHFCVSCSAVVPKCSAVAVMQSVFHATQHVAALTFMLMHACIAWTQLRSCNLSPHYTFLSAR